MHMQQRELDFFLGALSPTGFASYYPQLVKDEKMQSPALLKAGPGCGKSTLLRRVAEHLVQQGETVELIHCSADPASLDGVVCGARGFSAVDATPPHALEPVYPIVFEDIVSLYRAVDRQRLQQHREELLCLFRQHRAMTERATRYITAAGSLLQDSMRVALSCTNTEKARCFAATLARRYLPQTDGPAQEDVRLLSALTPRGLCFYRDTIEKLADTVVVLDDEYGAASRTLLYALRALAFERGHRMITCYCSMSPYEKIEHLFFPALRLCFVTSNSFHPIRLAGQRTIHCTRFSSADGLRLRRQRLRFNKKAAEELFAQATNVLTEAKACHDAIEAYYMDATDFAILEKAYRYLVGVTEPGRSASLSPESSVRNG